MSPELLLKDRGYDLNQLIEWIAEITKVTSEELFDTIRDARRTKARSIFCYWATEKPSLPQIQLAQMLRRTQSAITYAVRRGKTIIENQSYRLE